MILENKRVIEADAKDSFFFDLLQELTGVPKYVGLAASKNLCKTLGAHGVLYLHERQVRENSTDVLILSNASTPALWIFHMVAHAKELLVAPNPIGVAAACKQVALKHLVFTGVKTFTHKGVSRKYLSFKNIAHVKERTRKYISPIHGVRTFFKSVRDTKYVVLRWFENLPEVEEGEDIDVLLADEDIETFMGTMKEFPGTIPCDVYSVEGQQGFDYGGIAYFPPEKAASVLDKRVQHNEDFYVPDEKSHAYTLAFHALYHKGEAAGIPSLEKSVEISEDPEHEYQTILGGMGFDTSSLEALEEEVAVAGWKPPMDTLRRFSKSNGWLGRRYNFGSISEDGLVTFVIREKAKEHKHVDDIIQMIFDEGFSILYSGEIDKKNLEKAKAYIRGGNWAAGPWPVSGGDPYVVVVAHDVHPKELGSRERLQHPHVENARIIDCKYRVRKLLNKQLSESEACNVLHSSDNTEEALEYIDILVPDKKEECLLTAAREREAFVTKEEVLEDHTHNGRRAKVEKILHKGVPHIKKTFRPGREAFCRREVFVSTVLAKECNNIPPCIASGDLFVTYPFYENTLKLKYGNLIPLSVAKTAIKTLQFFYNKGYFIFDAHPTNVLVDKKEGVKLIDFEFVYPYEIKPKSFEESYDIIGAPDDFVSDQPVMHTKVLRKTYARCWQPYTGLSLKSLLSDPVWVQHVKRFVYSFVLLPQRVYALVYSTLSMFKNGVRKVLHMLNAAVSSWLGHSVKKK